MRIVVFNVIYSENLGDGILAQCLERALGCNDDIEVESVDLAGRPDFDTTSRHRQWAVRLLHRLPDFLRRKAVTRALRAKLRTLSREWDEKVATADAIILGGGNLFQDDDLNFPLKVGTMLDCVRRSGKPLAIFAVGVSADWSPQAQTLFKRISDTNLVYLSVRDGAARENWQLHFPTGPAPALVPDPGLLAGRLLGPVTTMEQRGGVGICVTNPLILARHSGRRKRPICLRTVKEYVQLIRLLEMRGHRLRLFCNGAREDQAFAERIFFDNRLTGIRESGRLQLAPRPRRPSELMEILSSVKVVLAHRLHACIAAYALGVPHVGIGWDQKVASFFRSVGRDGFFADDRGTTPEHLAFLVEWAAESGIDRGDRAQCLQVAEDAISVLRDCVLSRDTVTVFDACEREPMAAHR